MKKATYESPLEAEFDIPAGTTILPKYIGNEMVDQTTGEILPVETTDQNDNDIVEMEAGIVQNIDEVYTSAMDVFTTQSDLIETVDPKFAARNAEVANAYLNTALAAMKLKNEILGDKRKGRSSSGGQTANTINNNVIVADRNDILRMIQQNKEKK